MVRVSAYMPKQLARLMKHQHCVQILVRYPVGYLVIPLICLFAELRPIALQIEEMSCLVVGGRFSALQEGGPPFAINTLFTPA